MAVLKRQKSTTSLFIEEFRATLKEPPPANLKEFVAIASNRNQFGLSKLGQIRA
jgi:hypothetical protein